MFSTHEHWQYAITHVVVKMISIDTDYAKMFYMLQKNLFHA